MRRRSIVRAAATVVGIGLTASLSGCGSSGSGDAAGDGTQADRAPLSGLEGFTSLADHELGPATQTVTETDGSTWAYAHPGAGKITLLYFGYTRCPDECPTTMADIAGALARLPASERAQVAVQFVTTDPDRDTPPQIQRWVSGFDSTFIGGRAPIGQVVKAAATYAIGVSPPVKVHGQIEVTHGDQLAVLDPDGRMVGYFGGGVGPKAYAAALPELIRDYA